MSLHSLYGHFLSVCQSPYTNIIIFFSLYMYIQCIYRGSPEKYSQYICEWIYCKRWVHLIMKTKKSPNLKWANWRPRTASLKAGRFKTHEYGEGNGTPLQYFAWKIPWAEEPDRLQSMGSLRVGHDWVTSLSLFTFMHWRRKWEPTPVFLPRESQGQRSLVGCCLWDHTESDTTEVT